jgi:hypothetical protein
MNPELPFLAAGGIAIVGGAIRDKKWPANTTKAIIGTVVLTVLASASSDTPFAPLVHAVGLLVLLVAVLAAVKESKIGTTHA